MKKRTLVAVGIGLGVAVLAAVGYSRPMPSDITREEAHALVEKGARLVDVRTPPEYERGHVPGAVNIPLQVLVERMSELEPKDQPVVLYCHSGMRSGNAARILKQAGYAKVYNLGGMSAW